MKTKNIRLRFKDLFTGRIIYITEPGKPVIVAKVLRKQRENVNCMGFSFSDRLLKSSEIYRGSNYKVVHKESFEKVFQDKYTEIPETAVMAILQDYSFSSQNVVLELMNTLNETPVPVQDIYFDPAQSNTRVFAKYAQAKRYSQRFTELNPNLESFFEDGASA